MNRVTVTIPRDRVRIPQGAYLRLSDAAEEVVLVRSKKYPAFYCREGTDESHNFHFASDPQEWAAHYWGPLAREIDPLDGMRQFVVTGGPMSERDAQR